MDHYQKYKPFPPVGKKDRRWPDQVITKAPIWCSVDLRDGNQALEVPMTFEQKLDFFQFLVKMGFKEIEVGFPAASETEYRFTRALIERHLIPDDVTIQVLTQAREHIIRRTFEALDGAPQAIVHLYNSTSVLQREIVFGMSKEEIKNLAVEGAELVARLAQEYGPERFRFEYSPESFTGTELDYATEVCNAVLDVWKPTPEKPVIINLPNTVEMATTNIYADQIEYVCDHIHYRDAVQISLHAHNDRGSAVSDSELGVMAGADRVEGTLLGNGERTGNADILVMAMNLFSQGVDPELDFSHIQDIVDIYERSTGMSVHPRHPYAGKLVYTAFSGSHQDAIKKGMAQHALHPEIWQVPYLPIDPADVGRNYAPIIRINSQSGKGGVAYVLETNYGLILPRNLQKNFGAIVTDVSDSLSAELMPKDLYELFLKTYVITEPLALQYYDESSSSPDDLALRCRLLVNGVERIMEGRGNGSISALCQILRENYGLVLEVLSYSEHSIGLGTHTKAITYIEARDGDGVIRYGAGISSNVTKSSLRAVISVANQMMRKA
ncbi:MAG: 2-isopropylmalate synthase [Firmicutes bacterium]|nr:2-isopropylmalate synthase [Bacillota bacterium]